MLHVRNNNDENTKYYVNLYSTEIDIDNDVNEPVEIVENSNQILEIMISILEKAEKHLDTLFAVALVRLSLRHGTILPFSMKDIE